MTNVFIYHALMIVNLGTIIVLIERKYSNGVQITKLWSYRIKVEHDQIPFRGSLLNYKFWRTYQEVFPYRLKDDALCLLSWIEVSQFPMSIKGLKKRFVDLNEPLSVEYKERTIWDWTKKYLSIGVTLYIKCFGALT